MQAHVTHQGNHRKGRGFSCAEIEEAKLTCAQFDSMNLRWDSRRKSKHAENVKILMSMPKPAAKPAKAPAAAKPAKK